MLERMVLELRGIACLGLEEVHARSQEPDGVALVRPAVETRRGLEEAVSVYTARAAEKMRRQNLATASLAGLGPDQQLQPDERQYSASKAVRLPVATADTGKLIAAATARRSASSSSRAIATRRPASRFLDLVRGRPRAGRLVRPSRRCALDPPHARDRSAQRALRPRHGRASAPPA